MAPVECHPKASLDSFPEQNNNNIISYMGCRYVESSTSLDAATREFYKSMVVNSIRP